MPELDPTLLVALATLIGLVAPLLVALGARRKNNADASVALSDATLRLLQPMNDRITAMASELAQVRIELATAQSTITILTAEAVSLRSEVSRLTMENTHLRQVQEQQRH